MIRSIISKNKYIDVQKIIGGSGCCCFKFCNKVQKKVYKPMVPLTKRYNTLYIHPKFTQLQYPRPKSYFIYILPAIGMFVNNYLTQWTVWSSLAFGLLFLGGTIIHQNLRLLSSLMVSCIQVDPQLKYIIITSGKSPVSARIRNQYKLSNSQQKSITKSYHPFQQKYPESKYDIDVTKFKENKEYLIMNRRLQKKLDRFKIPIQQLLFRPAIKPAELPEFRRDMERLQDKQLMRKYEDREIIIFFKNRQSKQKEIMHFKLQTGVNNYRRHHDYLLALALNYKIDTSANTVFNEPQIQVDDQQLEEQTKKSNQRQKKNKERKKIVKQGQKGQNKK